VPTTVVPTTAPPPTLPAQPPDQLSQQQLRELVAPVALYPDVVLASLLPATTYPDQVADAASWLKQQPQPIQSIPDDRDWDGSVAGLLQFPDVLNWLDQNDPWEEQMGTAMTYQQGDVLQAIQDYRKLALDAGNLKSNEYMKVDAQPNQDIRIEPAQPDTVYVPQYDTTAVTQPQAQTGINPWLAFGGGAVVGALGAWALYSIFDDDDDDDHHHGGYKKKVKRYNNYYYGGRNRPPADAWNPRPRPYRAGRPGTGQIVRPRAVAPVYESKQVTRPAGSQDGGGLRPPQKRPGQQGHGGAQTRPSPAPGVAAPATETKKQGGGKGQGGGEGQGQGQGRTHPQQKPAPATQEGFQSKPKPGTKPQTKQQPQQKKQQANPPKKQNQNNENKKKKKSGGSN
jgi:hypothetical protein